MNRLSQTRAHRPKLLGWCPNVWSLGLLLLSILFLGACTRVDGYRVRGGQSMSLVQHNRQPNDTQIGADGFDVVAYFEQNRAINGDRKTSSQHNEVTYYFSTEKNRSAFITEPNRYLPAYGGYCAISISHNDYIPPATGNPESFVVKDGRLFFFFNDMIKKMWLRNPQKNIEIADKEWPKKQRAMEKAQ